MRIAPCVIVREVERNRSFNICKLSAECVRRLAYAFSWFSGKVERPLYVVVSQSAHKKSPLAESQRACFGREV